MLYIYAILLEKQKYYIGKTSNPQFRIESHFNSFGSAWTKKYKPLKIIEIKSNCDIYDEDKITLQYMHKYGINNVCGGSFISVKLDNSEIEIIKKMSIGRNDKCFLCGKLGHFANNCQEIEYSDSESDIEYEVWSCSYCGKEFDTRKGATFHENVHCNKKKIIKTIN